MTPRQPIAMPEFPSDVLSSVIAKAKEFPGGYVDLSTASPVDPTPALVRDALAEHLNAPGYPLTIGTVALREAIVAWWARVRGVTGLTTANAIPSGGSKEFLGTLPAVLGIGRGDIIVHPSVGYPTYAAGAAFVGATAIAEDDPAAWPEGTRLIWLNSPSNPTGAMLSKAELQIRVARARELGAVIVNDECYGVLNRTGGEPVPSILDPEVTGGDLSGVLATYSSSKPSSMAGYRTAFVTGDASLIAEIGGIRKHLGLIMPDPMQRALATILADDAHVDEIRRMYQRRHAALLPAVAAAGYDIVDSLPGLYIWATRHEDSRTSVMDLAGIGIVASPGFLYGAAGEGFVRFAVTVTDARLEQALERLPSLKPAG